MLALVLNPVYMFLLSSQGPTEQVLRELPENQRVEVEHVIQGSMFNMLLQIMKEQDLVLRPSPQVGRLTGARVGGI